MDAGESRIAHIYGRLGLRTDRDWCVLWMRMYPFGSRT